MFVPLGRMWVRSLSDHDDDQTTGLYLRKDRLTQYGLEQEPPIPEIDETALQDVRFVWTLRRRTEHPCSMAMVVDGDASGEFTGDVAYYNYRNPDEGVYEGSAAGTWADEGAQEMVEGLVEWAAGIGDMMDEMGLELPDGSELPTTEGLEQAKKKVGDKEVGWAEQLWGWDGENRGNDTFGLALADVELGNTALPDGTPRPPVEGFLRGAAKLASAASLGVSGRAVARKEVPATEEGQPEMEALLIEPSRVTAIAGVVDDNLEGIKYLWEPGRPGSATVVVVREIGSGVIRGIVAAELFPERTWAGGPQGLRVVATFRAMPTSLACQ